MNSEDINNADLALQIRKRSRSVAMRINHWVKAKAKGQLLAHTRTFDAENLYLCKPDIGEYWHEMVSTGRAEVWALFLGKEERWKVEAKGCIGWWGSANSLNAAFSKLFF